MKRMFMTVVAAIVLVAASVVATAAADHGKKGKSSHGWTPVVEACSGTPTGAQGVEKGPGHPPAGMHSYFFQTGANGDTYRTLRNGDFAGVKLSSLTALSYWTYVTSAPGQQAVYIDIFVDNDNDGDQDDILTLEPVYQSTPVAKNTWQMWNALTGLWWADSSGGPPPLFTLSSYSSSHPNARIVTDQPGLLLSAGCGGAAWTNFDGNVDLVRVGVNGHTRMYNFEANMKPKKAHPSKAHPSKAHPPKDHPSKDHGSHDDSSSG
jgi:hypothetical protein